MNFKPLLPASRLANPASRYVQNTPPATVYQTKQIVFKFKPGVSEQDVRRAVEYCVFQTNKSLAEAGKETSAVVESVVNYANGQVLVKGKGVGLIAEWVMKNPSPQPPPPPPPILPPDIFFDYTHYKSAF